MRRQLLLLRHAKSSWDDADLSDHDRPLAQRGLRAVAALRRHFSDVGVAPDLVLCSTARRARQTWEGVAGGCPSGTPVEFEDSLYGATAGELLRCLRRVPQATRCVVLVAHNPGLEDLAAGLIVSGDAELRRRLDTKFPTGALATLAVHEAWDELRWGSADLVAYVVPRELDPAE